MSSAHDARASVPLGLLAAMRAAVVAVMLAATLAPGVTLASSHKSTGYTTVKTAKTKIKRSAEAKRQFKRSHPCPSTGKSSGRCPGYIIDHVRPLCAGGVDAASNMQWQSKADAKAKDKLERQECRAMRKP